MSGIVGSRLNTRGSGLVGSLGTDGQVITSAGAGKGAVFEDAATTFDDTDLRNDIASLALHSAVADNKAAYNLPNSFIDQYEDDTGIATKTDTERDSSEFIHTRTVGSSFWTSDGTADPTRVTDAKFGTYCISFIGNNIEPTRWLLSEDITGITSVPTTGDFTVEFWYKDQVKTGVDRPWSLNNDDDRVAAVGWYASTTMNYYGMYTYPTSTTTTDTNFTSWTTEGTTTWTHHAVVRSGTTIHMFDNGTSRGTITGVTSNMGSASAFFYIARRTDNANEMYSGLMDEFRYSNSARWTSNFTPATSAYDLDSNTILLNHFEDTNFADSKQNGSSAGTHSATGTMISSTSVASAAQTKVSGVMLYKDNVGTATLGTDVKVYFTCDNGSNYTEAASYGTVSPVFSTGVKMVRLGETTCTSGTQVIYKIVFANQDSDSKDTQIHGMGVNY